MIYLLYGKNDYLINNEIKKIKDKNNITNDDISNYDLNEINIKIILDDAVSLPLFSEKKLIIVDNCNLFDTTSKKEDISVLEEYLLNPNSSTILILINHNEKLDERKKIFKILKENKSLTECNEININKLVKDNFDGYEISQNTINKFINRVGNNPYNLINEIEKLKIYKINDKKIIDEDILFASKNIEDNIFDLIDYIINKNYDKTIEIYNDLLNKNSEAIAVLIIIANQFRLMFQAKNLYMKGMSEKDIASSLEVHPYRVKLAIEKSRNYSIDVLLKYIESLADLDYEIKSGLKEAESALELFLLGM